MGNTFTVEYWDWELKHNVTCWRGESLFGAARAMLRCKLNGKKCISLIWRPIE